jgi:ribosomal protein L10
MGVKGGALSKHPLAISEIKALSELPSLEVLFAQVLALFNTPTHQFVRVLSAVLQDTVNV